MNSKSIITAAITGGVHVPSQSEYLPIKPEEIVEEAIRANKAGASIVHLHVRDPENGKPVSDLSLYKKVASEIKEKCNAILCITTGGTVEMSIEERIKPVTELRPELASCNMGSMNFALYPIIDKVNNFKYDWEKEYLNSTESVISHNSFKTIKYFLRKMYENNVIPEFEIYDVSHLNNLDHLLQSGYIKKPICIQFVLGILGGVPATARNLIYLLETANKTFGESEFEWSVAAAGKHQMPLCTIALTMGGNVRVGLEDNLYFKKGKLAESNKEHVEKIKRIADELSINIATTDEAKSILGLSDLKRAND